MKYSVYAYAAVMAVVTYLIRMLPLVLLKKEIKSPFLRSFLYYVPFSCLAAMTVPAVFFATENIISGVVGFCAALLLSWKKRNLLTVALAACGAVFITERLLSFL